jgi:hypothetical protein
MVDATQRILEPLSIANLFYARLVVENSEEFSPRHALVVLAAWWNASFNWVHSPRRHGGARNPWL